MLRAIFGAQMLGVALLGALMTAPGAAVTFQSVSSCPTSAGRSELPQVVGAADRRSCLVECAARADCAAVNRATDTGVCYLASYANWTASRLWQTGAAPFDPACLSHVKRALLPTQLSRKLRAFYNFRVSFDNLAEIRDSPPQPSPLSPWLGAAVPVNVNRSRDGALFASNMAAFIDVPGPLNLNQTDSGFSYFIKFRAALPLANVLPASLHSVFDSNPDSPTGYWQLHTNGTEFLQRSVRPLKMVAAGFAGLGVSLNISAPSLVSLGLAFEPATNAYKYFVGGSTAIRMTSPATASVSPDNGSETSDARLRIGYNTIYPITGHVICYAIGGTALSEAEMQLIDSAC